MNWVEGRMKSASIGLTCELWLEVGEVSGGSSVHSAILGGVTGMRLTDPYFRSLPRTINLAS